MRKRPENSWRQANSQGIWRKDGIERGTKNTRTRLPTWRISISTVELVPGRMERRALLKSAVVVGDKRIRIADYFEAAPKGPTVCGARAKA